MKLEGRIFLQNHSLRDAVVEMDNPGDLHYVELLDRILIELCHQLEVPLPIWLEKNTREFVRFRQTLFFSGQFTEPVKFDRFQIRLIE